MKAFLGAIVVGVVASGSALAADLSLPVARAPVAAGYDWSGVYVGAHVGGGWERTTFIDPSAAPIIDNCCFLAPFGGTGGTAAPTDARASSFLGGLQGGWMYQIGRLVVGGDFDLSWTRLNGSGAASYGALNLSGFFPVVPLVATETYTVSTKWTGTATTTIGLARDNWLFYSKFGAAWARQEYGLAINGSGPSFGGPGTVFPAAFGFSPANVRDTLVGWTVGTGVKVALGTNWFLNVEYDYMQFGSKGQNFTAVCATPLFPPAGAAFAPCLNAGTLGVLGSSNFSPTFNTHISEVKVGLNYKFPSGFLFW
jgi:outer membrane immunogenic protein